MIEQTFSYYLERYAAGTLTPQERIALLQLMQDPANADILQRIMDAEWTHIEQSDLEFPAGVARLHEAIAEAIRQENQVPAAVRPAHRVYFLRKWSWAAAAILLIGTTIAIVVSSDRRSNKKKPGLASVTPDIQPGTNKAVLTVDNKQIDLSPGKTGIVVGNTIAYTDGEKLSDAGKMLVLTTPNGGQYQLVLPDGTKAWLNAASSISFPSAFLSEKRQIKVSGEVYLEVAKDKAHPFLVDVDQQSTIEVLGTSFNINSYANEGEIKTTLIEGSVRIGTGRGAFNGKDAVMLKPGQQAIAVSSGRQPGNTAGIIVKSEVDLSQTLAWKNGLFSFNNADLRSVMRQLERWYDIKVRYEGNTSSITVDGEMFRNVKLSDVLEFLEESGLKFRMEGKTLIIL